MSQTANLSVCGTILHSEVWSCVVSVEHWKELLWDCFVFFSLDGDPDEKTNKVEKAKEKDCQAGPARFYAVRHLNCYHLQITLNTLNARQ